MSHLENFKRWYVRVLKNLYKDRHAGFPILIIALPLLERYLRQKSRSFEDDLNAQFFVELGCLFPNVAGDQSSRDFWHIYRNGLLHQVTFSQERRKKGMRIVVPGGRITRFAEPVGVDPNGDFKVDPVKFARKVTETILRDFITFEGAGSPAHTLPYSLGEPLSSLSPAKNRRPSP